MEFYGGSAMGQTHHLPSDSESDIAKVHLSIERIQTETDEKFGKIETDISNMKRSLQQTARTADSASSRLQDFEDVVINNQVNLENLLNDMHRQLSSVQQTIAASNTKLQHLERIGTIESSVLAFHNFMEKSFENHSILYQKLSQEVADTRGEISDMVVGICEHITTFQESTVNELTALQDSVNQWPDSHHHEQLTHHDNTTLLSELGSCTDQTDLGWGLTNVTGHVHNGVFFEELNSERDIDCPPITGSVVDDPSLALPFAAKSARFAFRTWTEDIDITVAWPTLCGRVFDLALRCARAWCPCWWSWGASPRLVQAVLGVLLVVMVMVIFVLVDFRFVEGPTQIEEPLTSTTGTGGRLMWQFCRDTWGTNNGSEQDLIDQLI